MTNALVATVERIYRVALARVHAGNAVANALEQRQHSVGVAGKRYATEHGVYAIAIGKAAAEMLAGAESALGASFVSGIGITKSAPTEHTLRSRLLTGAHPIADERSLAAGDALLAYAKAIPRGALVLCLISGGGSALVESLRPGVTLTELQHVTTALLAGGASIHELNAARSRMSALKGGGLLDALAHATVVNLIVSDVLGDDLGAIASGPTIPRGSALDAAEVLARYGVAIQLPAVPSAPRTVDQPHTVVIANVAAAIDAAARAAERERFTPLVLTRSLDGEAREVGRLLASIAADAAAGHTGIERRTAFIAGGETVVSLRGDGLGGRNSECALAAALRLEGVADIAFGCLATDGDDARTGAAGAIVTGATVTAANRRQAVAALERNDTYRFLHAAGTAIHTGPTGTNVNDLVITLLG